MSYPRPQVSGCFPPAGSLKWGAHRAYDRVFVKKFDVLDLESGHLAATAIGLSQSELVYVYDYLY